MGHYAKVYQGVVQSVIVAKADFIAQYSDGKPGRWVKTSYNTRAGVHTNGGTPLRKNYAGIGFIYDSKRDAFYEPQPYASWILNEDTCVWEPPTARPDDGSEYIWNEATTSWELADD